MVFYQLATKAQALAIKAMGMTLYHIGEQVADVFTGPLAREKFQKLREMLGLWKTLI
jgi:hypothetical protein